MPDIKPDPLDFWKSLAGPAVGAVTGAGLGYLGNRGSTAETRRQNAWMRQQYEQALQRRMGLQGLALPSMIRALGYSEDKAKEMAGQYQQNFGSGSGAGAQNSGQGMNYSPDKSRIGQVAGLGAGILGTAAGLGVGQVAGLGVGAGFLGSQFGKGRRTANPFVDQVENPFGQELSQISQMAATYPKAAALRLQQAETNYKTQTQNWISKGGEHANVAQQSLQNQGLQSTVARLKQQLGIV